MSPPGQVTELLEKWSRGDRDALEQLVPIVYDELRKLAAGYLRRESAGQTLQATALVHEIYLRLVEQERNEFHSRAHFYGAAAQIIRRILVDRAREKNAAKRGGQGQEGALEEALAVCVPADVDMIDLDRALLSLEEFDAKKARLVELRYFAGLSIPQTAELMGVSPRTVTREWATARAWLFDRLRNRGGTTQDRAGHEKT
jgi:RNA polymerase sigma factor (TIGR02999 family)